MGENKRMAVPIMVQGTMSNAGKSLITAGLCRVFVQDGYKVAPFKSQNMALNSYITEEGLEMGRAQAMQAEACNKKPSVFMNPILLKPTTDIGSQVIVNGEVKGNMLARDYSKYKKELIPDILEAYNKIAMENDIIVIEGAGSPAEINLKNDDIVNMGMAKLVDANVLLVGDIDRGGVFAQLAGTLLLLEDEEKDRIKGLIINKFRGDKSILDPGIAMLQEITDKEVVGVVPYANLDIEDEDSLSERFEKKGGVGQVEIAVIKLPRISNFTDFTPLESIEGVSLHYVTKPEELKQPDLIILPGSKSTISDLKWLRESGIETMILKCHSKGSLVIGICGGYQMLGYTIVDEEGSEGFGSIEGMKLLPMDTIFETVKTRTRAKGKILPLEGIFQTLSDVEVSGYEIHMGISWCAKNAKSFAKVTDANCESENYKLDGCVDGTVFGTYLHGIFENRDFTQKLLKILLERKGLDQDQLTVLDYKDYKMAQYDKLADVIRGSVDLERIYSIMGLN